MPPDDRACCFVQSETRLGVTFIGIARKLQVATHGVLNNKVSVAKVSPELPGVPDAPPITTAALPDKSRAGSIFPTSPISKLVSRRPMREAAFSAKRIPSAGPTSRLLLDRTTQGMDPNGSIEALSSFRELKS